MLGVVKSWNKGRPTACSIAEAEVVGGRHVERLGVDVDLHGRLDEDMKEDPAQHEAVGTEQWLLSKTTSKTSWNEMQKYSPFSSFVGVLRR